MTMGASAAIIIFAIAGIGVFFAIMTFIYQIRIIRLKRILRREKEKAAELDKIYRSREDLFAEVIATLVQYRAEINEQQANQDHPMQQGYH